MRLSGLTGLTLRREKENHNSTLTAVLPWLTALRSLELAGRCHPGLPAAGGRRCSDTDELDDIGGYVRIRGS
jgi:hypothetical protein